MYISNVQLANRANKLMQANVIASKGSGLAAISIAVISTSEWLDIAGGNIAIVAATLLVLLLWLFETWPCMDFEECCAADFSDGRLIYISLRIICGGVD